MPFRPLSARFDALPLVLAGPILRRVDGTSVSVWVATRERCDVTLHVARADAPTDSFSGTAAPAFVQKNLFITLVRAVAAAPLKRGAVYVYSLTFQPQTGSPLTLAEATDNATFGYGPYPSPSFITPHADAKSFTFLHGSCRKPHGPPPDALTAVSDELEATVTSPQRPVRLLLTGDQIYADDVANGLLAMIMDSLDVLWRAPEVLPDHSQASAHLPDQRALFLLEAGFTAGLPEKGNAKSHLLTLGEYVAMYLFVWSDVLWPSDTDFSQVAPEEELSRLKAFRDGLKEVRRALANVATYMVFDDHDVTDDWNLNRGWCEAVYGGGGLPKTGPMRELAEQIYEGETLVGRANVGRRIVLNALTAFLVCQAWGNDPAVYAAGVPHGLFETAKLWFEGNPDPDVESTLAEFLLPPKNAPIAGDALAKPSNAVPWSFALDDGFMETLFLDTRTLRRFPGSTSSETVPTPAALLEGQRLVEQLGKLKGRSCAFIVSPAPVLGVELVELLQRFISQGLKGRLENDFEAWSFDEPAFFAFLRSIAQGGTTGGKGPDLAVFLSGDLHYGFSFRLELAEQGGARRTVFAQCTSSALKNFDEKKKSKRLRQVESLVANKRNVSVYLFDNPGGQLAPALETLHTHPKSGPFAQTHFVRGDPAGVLTGAPVTKVHRPPQWTGRLDTLADQGPRQIQNEVGSSRPALRRVAGGKTWLRTDSRRIVVDDNHVARITFDVANGKVAAIHHQLIVLRGDVLYETHHVAAITGTP